MRQRQPLAAKRARHLPALWRLVAAAVVGVFAPLASASASADVFQLASMPNPVTHEDVTSCQTAVANLTTYINSCQDASKSNLEAQEARVADYKAAIKIYTDKIPTGLAVCEGHNFGAAECDARGCCHFDVSRSLCVTTVGTALCPQLPGASLQGEVGNLQQDQDQLYREIKDTVPFLLQAHRHSKFLHRATAQREAPIEEEEEGAKFWAFHASAIRSEKNQRLADTSAHGLYDVEYRGCQSRTNSGRECMKWTSNTPHAHIHHYGHKATHGIGDHNYCRNPENLASGAWCFTVDPDMRWESCTVQASGDLSCTDKWLSCNGDRTTKQKLYDSCLAENSIALNWNAGREQDYSDKVKRFIERDLDFYNDKPTRSETLQNRKNQLASENARLQQRLQALRDGVSTLPSR